MEVLAKERSPRILPLAAAVEKQQSFPHATEAVGSDVKTIT